MSEVFFYHLTRAPLEVALPELLEKILSKGWRALIRGGRAEVLETLDSRLWTGQGEGFLPHGLAGGPHDGDQPILLTSDEGNPNKAEILLLVAGGEIDSAEVSGFTRVCVMFDGNDPDELTRARGDWKRFTDAGLAAQYWAQEDRGWVKKQERAAS